VYWKILNSPHDHPEHPFTVAMVNLLQEPSGTTIIMGRISKNQKTDHVPETRRRSAIATQPQEEGGLAILRFHIILRTHRVGSSRSQDPNPMASDLKIRYWRSNRFVVRKMFLKAGSETRPQQGK
jgi:hypothetical protein